MQARQGEVQNLTATINGMAQGFEATQAAIQQLFTNQIRAQGGQPQAVPVDPNPEAPIAMDVPVEVLV